MSLVVAVAATATAASTVPLARDTLGEFLLLLESRAGQDKFTRLIQYAAKYTKWQMEVQKKEEYVTILGNVYSSMSLVRKVLRLFRTFAVLRAIRTTWPGMDKLDMATLFNIAAKLCLATYFAADHLMLANRFGIWKPDADTLDKANTLTEGSWLGEIVFTLLEQILKYGALLQCDDSPAVATARGAAFRALVRNGLDLPIALHFLKKTGDIPHGYFGAAGAITSAISIWEMWPTVYVQ